MQGNEGKGKKSIVLIGGGGHCRSVLDSLKRCGEYEEIFITDPSIPPHITIDGAIVVGDDSILFDLYHRGVQNAFITVGSVGKRESLGLRRQLYDKVSKIGFEFPAIIDSSAIVANTASISEGAFVGKGAIVNADAIVGKMTIINSGAIIEHDCFIGDYSHVSIGAVIAGDVRVEEYSFIGANATIIQGKKIGTNCVIGAGAIVLSNVPDASDIRGIFDLK